MKKFDILNIKEKGEGKLFSNEVVSDLKLDSIVNGKVISILCNRIDESTILARQEILKLLDNNDFFVSFKKLRELLFEFERAKAIFDSCQNDFAKLISFLPYIESFCALSFWEYDCDSFFINRVNDSLKTIREDISNIKDKISKYKMLCSSLNNLEMCEQPNGFTIKSCDGKKSIVFKLQQLSAHLGFDYQFSSKLQSEIRMSSIMSSAIIESNDDVIKELISLEKDLNGFISLDILEMINGVDFYFTLNELKDKALNKNIDVCFPVITKKSGYFASCAFDVTLMENTKDIVANDIAFEDNKAFFFWGQMEAGKRHF